MWAGQLNIGICEWWQSPVFKQNRWQTDPPVCITPIDTRAALSKEGV